MESATNETLVSGDRDLELLRGVAGPVDDLAFSRRLMLSGSLWCQTSRCSTELSIKASTQ
jgi:hypothetical protein